MSQDSLDDAVEESAGNRIYLVALTKEAAEITSISFIMEHDRQKAEEIISGAEK